MTNKAMLAFAQNTKRLLKHYAWSQPELARRSGIGQTTISAALRYPDADKIATLDTVNSIAKAFGLESWQLQIPDAPLDLLLSRDLAHLIGLYADVGAEGRTNITRVAESEARYEAFRQEKAG